MRTHDLDASGRRSRKRRLPTGQRTTINERALIILETLHLFGQLPTRYLFPAQEHLARNYPGFVRLLGKMYHERTFRFEGQHLNLPEGAGLIGRSARKGKVDDPLASDEIYFIEKWGVDVVKKSGRYVDNAFVPSGPWLHRFMQSCVMASIAIEAAKIDGVKYIHQHEIIGSNQPSFKLRSGYELKSDGVCAIERNGRRFYFFIEADRNTEPLKPQDPKKRMRKGKYWDDTVRAYNRLIGDNLYKELLKIDKGHNAFLLNITLNEMHMHNMVDVVEQINPNGNKFILSQYYTEFLDNDRHNFKVPGILPLLTEPWARAGRDDFYLTK